MNTLELNNLDELEHHAMLYFNLEQIIKVCIIELGEKATTETVLEYLKQHLELKSA